MDQNVLVRVARSSRIALVSASACARALLGAEACAGDASSDMEDFFMARGCQNSGPSSLGMGVYRRRYKLGRGPCVRLPGVVGGCAANSVPPSRCLADERRSRYHRSHGHSVLTVLAPRWPFRPPRPPSGSPIRNVTAVEVALISREGSTGPTRAVDAVQLPLWSECLRMPESVHNPRSALKPLRRPAAVLA